MDPKIASLRTEVRSEAQQLDLLQKDMQTNQQARSTFLQQQQENVMVLQELNLLEEEANVFKLIGPALVKQDPVEAKSNVEKRLEFINHELGRLETQAKHLEDKRSQKHAQIRKLQEQIQRQARPVEQ